MYPGMMRREREAYELELIRLEIQNMLLSHRKQTAQRLKSPYFYWSFKNLTIYEPQKFYPEFWNSMPPPFKPMVTSPKWLKPKEEDNHLPSEFLPLPTRHIKRA